MKGMIKKAAFGIGVVLSLALFAIGNDAYAKVMHNVTYIYGPKSVTVQVAHGKNAPVPTDTDVPGFVFTSWIGSAANVTEDRAIRAWYYERNTAGRSGCHTAFSNSSAVYFKLQKG